MEIGFVIFERDLSKDVRGKPILFCLSGFKIDLTWIVRCHWLDQSIKRLAGWNSGSLNFLWIYHVVIRRVSLVGTSFKIVTMSFAASAIDMEKAKWTRHSNALGLVGVLTAIACVAFSFDKSFSLPRINSFQYFQQDVTKAPLALTIDQLPAAYRKGCPKQRFTSLQLVSRVPKMILIEGFMTESEAEFLVRIA